MHFYEVIEMLKRDEGFRQHPYTCTAGKTTIAYGRNLTDNGITESEGLYLLQNDVSDCDEDLSRLMLSYENFPHDIQIVLVNMRYNLGYSGFRSFKNMIAAFNARDYNRAAKEMKDSKWYNQVRQRAERLIKIVKEQT